MSHHFQVNLRGVIELLSGHLYSGPQVYLRELLQNAVDAVTARRRLDPSHEGQVRLEIIAAPGQRAATLSVCDNGIGLTEEEVHEFLATIGQSSKRGALERRDFLGQFGIGLLSGFVVCEEIVVVTRSARPGHPAVEWKGRSDGTYSVRTLDYDIEPGAQVFLRSKPGCEEFFAPDWVRETAEHFGGLLPGEITLSAAGQTWRINRAPPWREAFPSEQERREGLLDYGRDLFGADFLDVIPLHSEIGGVDGVAFVLPHAASVSARRAHRVYLKRMLLSEEADNLLPDWAFFVKCVVNVNDLRPTASRESFYEDDDLAATRRTLGECLRSYLVRLANEDRRRLDMLVDLHHLAIKSLALDDDEFFRIFAEWLPFETSLGPMSLGEYLDREPVVRYVRTRDQFRQVAGVASAQSICVINGGYTYDSELLEKLPQILPQRSVERIEPGDLAQNFAELSTTEAKEAAALERLAELTLAPYKCSVEIKKFEPRPLPTLYTTNEAAQFLRSIEQTKEVADELWSEVLDSLAEDPLTEASAQLCLNYANPLVRKIARLSDEDLARRAIEMLYVQSLLMGHYPLKAGEMRLLNEGLLGLIDLCVEARGQGKKP